MTLEQQVRQSETYTLAEVNGTHAVVAETAPGSGLPIDGDGLVGTVAGGLSAQSRELAIQRLQAILDAQQLPDDTVFRAEVMVPSWRINDVAKKRSEARLEAIYAASAIARASEPGAITNHCLRADGSPRLVMTPVMSDNTSRVGLYAVTTAPLDDALGLRAKVEPLNGEIRFVGVDEEAGIDTPHLQIRFLLAQGHIYAAHRAFRLEQAHTQPRSNHPSNG
jgi:hypothetical protein